ncbi:RNA 2'-phosphotransferase [Pannonibacter phragmitetus]|uniref:Probable RNA 2'-phosphotransferase n=1 Tax=Pannonibacter phragmitetus TaxID=121719 RepID=A0A0U3ENT5_9HYPH|nr:RNA 2'-phosphotransferase [Pannonibacter phragmitetus]ALV27823.1 RNA 2'-phosphotransferase [Pannonibacter phragmitetus]
MSEHHTEISKFLSFVLRHKPEAIGLELDPEGWAEVDTLIAKSGIPLTPALLRDVVASSDKQRFALSADGLYIRANQGHSIAVNLGLEAIEPPEWLYHGTATRFLDSIQLQGLRPQNRQHVHLSADPQTARNVGKRHGQPTVLTVSALLLHREGHPFFRSRNGVWLTTHVPQDAISELSS